ncbi:MAG: response regulator [Chloroflexi bacterium]|nr:response regulator [Chloroflexota bacterium]
MLQTTSEILATTSAYSENKRMGVRILVIEDVHALRSDLVELLRLEGFEVQGAENGRIGLDIAYEFKPDLVVCDIMMPELDGYGVLEGMRAEPDLRTVPFIFMTAKTDRSDIRRGMGLGADDYLTKPVENDELLAAIRARLDKRVTIEEMTEVKLTQLRDSITTALPHELRTPLNTIIGFSDMLMMEAPDIVPEQVLEWAGHINNSALRLHRLVENYLTYVRIQALMSDPKRLSNLRKQFTSTPHITAEHQAIFRAQSAQREADLTLHHGIPAPILIGEHDLMKILDEILDNAFKFSEAGTPVIVQTGVEPAEDGDVFRIRVTDYGRSMSQEQIKAAGAYMQFDRVMYEQQGSGLGVAIARGLTELYDGRFEIEGEQNDHLTVTLTFGLVPFH